VGYSAGMSDNTHLHGHQGKVQIELAEPSRALPIHDPMERRAIAMNMAIQVKGATFTMKDSEPAEVGDFIIKLAKMFERYIAGE